MAGREEYFNKAMKMGHSAAWEQQWDRAAQYYRQALDDVPNHPGALTSLGLALFELQEYEEALRCYIQANKVTPEDPLPIEKIAQIYERLGKPDLAQIAASKAAELHLKNHDVSKAIDNWKTATRLNPDNVQAHTRLALVYERLGQKEQAVSEFLILAALFQQSGQVDKAYQAINHSIQLVPGNTPALDAMEMLKERRTLPRPSRASQAAPAVILDHTHQLEAPVADRGADVALDPIGEARQKALAVMAGMLFEGPEGQTKAQGTRRGLQAIVRGTDSGPSTAGKQTDATRILFYLSQVVDLQSRGESSQAARELERAMEVGLDHPAAFFDLGLLHYQNGRMESALRILQHAVQHPDFALASRFIIGQVLQQQGKTKDASVQFMKALSLADAAVVPPKQANDLLQIYEPLIEAQTQIADNAYHQKVCENISELLNRSDWRAQLSRARQQLAAQSDGNALIPIAEVITQARSSQAVESLTRINELVQAGYINSAMEEAFHALQFAPTYLPLHAQMGEMLLKQNQIQEAIDKFVVVAKSYNTRGEARRGVDIYRRITEIAPLELTPRRQMISQLVAIGQIEDALKEQMSLADVYYSLADLENSRKAYVEAFQMAQQYSMDRSWPVRILHRLADIYLQSLDWRQALRAYEQICTIKPDDERARTGIVEINFRMGQEAKGLAELDNYLAILNKQGMRDKGIEFLNNLLSDAPGKVALRSRLAEQYRLSGQVPEAVAEMDEVAEALLQAGDQAGAIRTVEAILRLNPPNAVEYQQMLSKLKMGSN